MSKRQHPNPSFAGYEIDSEHGFVSVQVNQPGLILILENARDSQLTYFNTSFNHNGNNLVIFPLVKPGLYTIKNSTYGNSGKLCQVEKDIWTQASFL
jgi:hypothetical protein